LDEQTQKSTAREHDKGMAQVVSTLDQVELTDPLIRRFGLIQLLERRFELERQYKGLGDVRRSRRIGRRYKYSQERLNSLTGLPDNKGGQKQGGKADSKALAARMTECYPHLQKPVKNRPEVEDTEYIEKKRSGIGTY
jgi:hypothetical protein